MNRRRMLLALTGLGTTALVAGVVVNRDSSAPVEDKGFGSHSASLAGTETPTFILEVACAGDQLAFNPSHLIAPAGVEFHLIFHNVSTIFSHNWLLINGGDEVLERVLEAAVAAGAEKFFVPEDLSDIVAHTPLVDRGDSATVTFAAPPAGEYIYICTYPGHCLAGMRGTLTINA